MAAVDDAKASASLVAAVGSMGSGSGSKIASAAAADAYKQHAAAFHNLIRPHKMRGDIGISHGANGLPGQAPCPMTHPFRARSPQTWGAKSYSKKREP